MPAIDPGFLHALLHDLNGPVSRMRMLGELLARRINSPDPEIQDLLQHLGTSAAAAERVLEGVRRYAEALRWVYRPSRFDLTLALQAAQGRLNGQLAANGASVTHGPLPEISADMMQMTALFEELIANALRFRSTDSPAIEVTAESGPGTVLISVLDNGIGCGNSANTGIAICRRIAELHGGDIASIPRERGAGFLFRIPQ